MSSPSSRPGSTTSRSLSRTGRRCAPRYFKSIKSVARLTFTDERPVSFWEEIQASEYGFWANVNPEVPHPRWSQAEETPLGNAEKVPTLLFNGYAEFVAELYVGMENKSLFM